MIRQVKFHSLFFLSFIFLVLFGSRDSLHAQVWSSPPVDVSLFVSGEDADAVEIAASPGGRFVATWFRFSNSLGFFVVQGSTSTDGIAWSAPVDLSDTTGLFANAFNPQITCDSSGRFVVVWEQRDKALNQNYVLSSSSTDGVTWSPPATLSGPNCRLSEVTVSPADLFVAIWQNTVGVGDQRIQASASADGLAWSAAVDVSTVGEVAADSEIVVDGSGRFVAAWSYLNLGIPTVKASTSTNGTLWSVPTILSPIGEVAESPQVAGNAAGQFAVVWSRNEMGNREIKSAGSSNGMMWTGGVVTPVPATTIGKPQIAADSSGIFVTLWPSSFGANSQIQSSVSSDGINWGANSPLSNAIYDSAAPHVYADPTGGFIAVWMATDMAMDSIIQSSLSENGVAWSFPSDASPAEFSNADPHVATAANGLSVVVWEFQQNSDAYIILAAGGITIAVQPPASVSGQRIANRFLTQTNLVNQLRWGPSPSADIAGYRIYRNGVLIASVSWTTFLYNDSRGNNRDPAFYQITAVNSSGDESAPIDFTVD